MRYRHLGRSGLKVSELSLGSWITFGKQIEDSVAENLMAAAYDRGINFFDNAEVYAYGKSEIVMGKILKKMKWDRSSYIVSSKAFFGRGDTRPNMTGLSRKHLTEACHEALQRLQLDYLDLYFCHRPDKNTPIEETVWAMNILLQQGKILYWGTSEWSAQEITEAWAASERYRLTGPLMEQPQYNMFHRKNFEVNYAQLYKNYGLGTTIWSPLASGLLTGKYNEGLPSEDTRLTIEGMDWLKERTLVQENIEKVRKLAPLAAELGMSLPVMALAWCLKNPHVSTVILGASKLAQLEENMKAIAATELLTTAVMDRIEDILNNKPEQPIF